MAKLSQIKLGDTTYDLGVAWGNVSGKPSTFPPSSHTHDHIVAKDVYTFTSSTLPNNFDLGVEYLQVLLIRILDLVTMVQY